MATAHAGAKAVHFICTARCSVLAAHAACPLPVCSLAVGARCQKHHAHALLVRMPHLPYRRTRLYTEPMSALLEEYWDFLHVSAGGLCRVDGHKVLLLGQRAALALHCGPWPCDGPNSISDTGARNRDAAFPTALSLGLHSILVCALPRLLA